MRLEPREMPDWPSLAWLARCGDDIELWHGPGVEVAADWAYEGAWTGRFEEGTFDEVAVSLGSGVRIRGDAAVFVTPTSTIDRLCHMVTPAQETLVSNSLLALLQAAGATVTDPKYHARVTSIVRGIDRCRSSVATSAGPASFTYFRNLVWSSGRLDRCDKPELAPLGGFGAYNELLAMSFQELGANMAHSARRFPLGFLGTLSSGYDANAATALAVGAGCRAAICFETTGRGHPDSGVPVAAALGIEPIVIGRDAWRSEPQLNGFTEVPFLAAGGGSGLIGFHGAREHLAGAVLVSGFYGDSIWNPEWSALGTDIVRKDASGLGFCEYRLHAGFVNCAPAFWAAREVAEVVGISSSAEMEPWVLGAGYDRPVPRRIAEEAGVPREAFGHAKRAVPKAQPHRDRRFLTPAAKRDYFSWLRGNRGAPGVPRVISPALDRAVFAWRTLALRAHVAAGRIPPLGRSGRWESRRQDLKQRHRRPTPLRSQAVAWALARGKRAYGPDDSSLNPDLRAVEADPAMRLVAEGLPAAAPGKTWLRRHSKGVSIAFGIAVTAALIVGLYDKRDAFAESLGAASPAVLAGAVGMQVVWLIARSEAWHVCVLAAGGTAGRRALYRAAAIGYLGNLLNSSFGLAVRIAELRRTDPSTSPRAGALIAAELPIVVIEIALAAICSFTLVGPLGIPWWTPLIALAVAGGIVAALSRLADRKREGFWQGLAVMRGLAYRNRIIALTIFAVSAQVFRNWLVLQGIGVDITLLDSVALLVATAAVGLLPVGPTLGVTTSILILGSKGVAQVAAAGALLTATGAVGALCFASWSLADRLRMSRRPGER